MIPAALAVPAADAVSSRHAVQGRQNGTGRAGPGLLLGIRGPWPQTTGGAAKWVGPDAGALPVLSQSQRKLLF